MMDNFTVFLPRVALAGRREINLISQCDKFNTTLSDRKPGTGDATSRKITLSRGANRI